ncbi:MAG: cobyric acid synthase [Rhodoglobus sp.]
MIVVLDLYPGELNINGDVGNVMALTKRAQWRGMPLSVVSHEPGDALPDVVHLVHIGSGPLSEQPVVRDDLAINAMTLRSWAEAGVPFLAVAGGWQLLGVTTTDRSGVVTPGVGVFPTTAVLTDERVVREVWTPEFAGYENHGADTSGMPSGPNKFVFEHGASVATTLHGPFLPMNPSWADRLLERAAVRAGVPLGEADARTIQADEYAAKSREAIRKRLRS